MSSVAPPQPGPSTVEPGSPPLASGHSPVEPGHPPAAVGHWPASGSPADPALPAAAPEPTYLVPEPDRFTLFMTRLWQRSPRWLAPAAILACIGGATAYTLITDPTDGAADAVPTCLVKLTTGFDCPGCGGTRAFWYLIHGNLPAAARHHALFVFAVPFLIYLYIAWAGQQLFRWRLPQLRITPTTVGLFLVAWLAFTVIRNLPWAAFTWLYV